MGNVLLAEVLAMNNFEKIADAGKSFVCGLYRTVPGSLVETPISDVLRISYDSLCGDDVSNLPNPPSTPFQGGQCVGVLYEVACFINGAFSDLVVVYGSLGGVRGRREDVGNGETRTFYEIQCHGSQEQGYIVDPIWFTYRSSPNRPPNQSVTMAVQRRVDGRPDNCGDPPASYPPTPAPPPDGYISPSTSIPYNDGTGFNVSFRFQPPRSSDNTSFPSICVLVALSGKEIELCYPIDGVPRLAGGEDNLERMLRELQNNLTSFREAYDQDNPQLAPEDDPTLKPTPLDGDDGGEEDAPDISWLVITLINHPDKSQFGTPVVYFAGWASFRIGSSYTERMPIGFEKSVFKAPKNANGYSVTFTNKASGAVVSYAKQPIQGG